MKGESADYRNVAVLIPCYNEEITVAKVVADFKSALAGAQIYVYDNNSVDQTAAAAARAGAKVVSAPRQGKGNVVKQMFDEVEAEIYLMVDGDDTYPAASAPALIAELGRGDVDMVVGARVSDESMTSRRFHRFGNRLVAGLISRLFSAPLTDVLSGYRVFSRDFVKSVPLLSSGFEIEVEMTLQAIGKGFVIKEAPVNYGRRPEGSFSKLGTFSDGFRVLKTLVWIFKDYKPLFFFSALGLALFLTGIIVGIPPIKDYFLTGYVRHVPLAILAAAVEILAALSIGIGLILDSVSKYHRENFEMMRRMLKKR